LYEYQGKQLLQENGLSIPAGAVASTAEEAGEIAEKLGRPVAVKAQIWVTGRGKAGGISFADDAEEARAAAGALLHTNIKGFKVEKVLVEEKLDIEDEYYIGIIVDGSYKVRSPVVIFSTRAQAKRIEASSVDPRRGYASARIIDYHRRRPAK